MAESATTKKLEKIESKEIGSIESYVEEVGGTLRYLVESENELMLFRGQDKQRNLLPGIARNAPEVDTTHREKTIVEQLELLGASFPELSKGEDLDKLVVAQHFGLKTRLLDWSSNPLVALHFACTSRIAGDVYVYVLNATSLLVKDVYKKNPFTAEQTAVFQPRLNNPRIIAQHGWFTLHRYSQKSKRFVALEKTPRLRRI